MEEKSGSEASEFTAGEGSQRGTRSMRKSGGAVINKVMGESFE